VLTVIGGYAGMLLNIGPGAEQAAITPEILRYIPTVLEAIHDVRKCSRMY
jgi:hypothetical protein